MFSYAKTYLKTEYGIAILLSSLILVTTLINQAWSEFIAVVDQTAQFILSARTQTAAALDGADSGLIAWWKFDDGSGTTAADSSGGGNNGTLTNGLAWTTGQIGGALSFDGVNNYVNISTAPTLTAPYSTSIWFYLARLGSQSLVYYGFPGRGMFVTNGNVIEFDSYSAGTFRTFCNKTLTDADLNRWHHLAFIVNSTTDASQWKCYLDGTGIGVANSNSTGTYIDPPNTGWRIGASTLSNYYLSGKIDDARIYNRELSPQEISDLYGLGGNTAPPTPPPPVTPPPSTPPINGSGTVSPPVNSDITRTVTTAQTSSGNETTALSCSLTDVQTAVNSVTDGGIVHVPAGNCVWNSMLTVNQAIVLQGASGATTNISSTINPPLIKYAPNSPSSSHRFRITNFTFTDTASSNYGIIYLYQNTATPEFIRIDHNVFNHQSSRATYIAGTFFGVVDNNTFNNSGSSAPTSTYGNDSIQWNAFGSSRAFGDGNNLYYEDNIYNTTGGGMMNDGGQGGRYVSRYNTFNGNFSYVYDFHGNQPGGAGCFGASTCGNASTMVVEIYGNYWNRTTSGYLNRLLDQRGGMAMVYTNKLSTNTTGTTNMGAREEYSDNLWPVNSGWIQHVTNSYYWSNWNTRSGETVLMPQTLESENSCSDAASPWIPGHLYGSASASSDIYSQKFTGDPTGSCWKKSQYSTPMVPPYLSGSVEPNWASVSPRYAIRDGNINWLNMGKGTPIAENVDFFTQRTGTFDGSGLATQGGGVGCGTLASRPTLCTTGVAYWATNQSCTDMSGMVGANPSNPISGTLYECTSPNSWKAYYTPYAYPHPLRASADAVLPPPSLITPLLPQISGLCSATLNACTVGTFSDTADTATQYSWNCLGSNGGAVASCSLPVTAKNPLSSPTPVPTVSPSVTPKPVPTPVVSPVNPKPVLPLHPVTPVKTQVNPASRPNTLTGQRTSNPSIPTKIIRNLKLDDQGQDVLLLQKTLNSLGYKISVLGSGSPGHETASFDANTKLALIKYQTDRAYGGILPTGILDNATLTLINDDITKLSTGELSISASSSAPNIPATDNPVTSFIRRVLAALKDSLNNTRLWVKKNFLTLPSTLRE